jgi:hypothetical protein
MTKVVVLPLKFWSDHKYRGCSESAIELKRNKIYVTVELDEESWKDIYSDAEFYATYDAEYGEEDMKALKSSAIATLKRLQESKKVA